MFTSIFTKSECFKHEETGFIYIYFFRTPLLIKKHCQIKLQRLQKGQIRAFESLVHQINSL